MITGYRTIITAVVMIVVAGLQLFGIINFNLDQFAAISALLGSLAAIFLHSAITRSN